MATDTTARVRLDLRRTWLIWSCLPLAGFLLGLAATTAVYASAPVLSQKRAEDSFYTFLAVCALVFLFGFTVDGYWTNPRRIDATIRRRGNGGDQPVTAVPPETRAQVASQVVVSSASSLGFMGHVIGLAGILCLIGGAGTVHAYLLLSLAVSYQLYLFSRHPYYERVVDAARKGELLVEEDQKGKSGQRDNRK